LGTSNQIMNYSYTDAHTLTGINYYRLKQVDFDGKSEYSKIESVYFDGSISAKISMYPNPVNKMLTIEHTETNEQAIIYNSIGQKMIEVKITDARTTIDMTDFASGSYRVIILKDNVTVKAQQVIKK
jgi:hypothetical protein